MESDQVVAEGLGAGRPLPSQLRRAPGPRHLVIVEAASSSWTVRATPTAPPSWRWVLYSVEARPMPWGEMVAKAAVWAGTNSPDIPNPIVRSRSRAHHKLDAGPIVTFLIRRGAGTRNRNLQRPPS